MEKKINNKIILITGGSSGLGLAMAHSFLDKNAKLLIILDINEKQGVDAATALCSKYGENKAVFYKCNVAVDLEDIFEKIIDTYKHVDVVINNAGILNEKSIRNTIDVNTIAVMEWTVKFYEHMKKDGKGGTIINVSSIYGFRITPFLPYYHASKYAVLGFSKSLGHEYNYKKSGVRVLVLCPGLTHTNITNNPICWDEESRTDFFAELENTEWQNDDAIGRGIIEIFEKAESGSVWLVEGSRPAVMI